MKNRRTQRLRLYNSEPPQSHRHCLTLKEGCFNIQGGRDSGKTCDTVWGHLEGIYTQSTTNGNRMTTMWNIDLKYGEDMFTLKFPYHATNFKIIVMSLCKDESINSSSIVEIVTSKRNGKTHFTVRSDNKTLGYDIHDLPSVIEKGRESRNITAQRQMEYISKLVGQINRRVCTNG